MLQIYISDALVDPDSVDIAAIGDVTLISSLKGQRYWSGRELVEPEIQEFLDVFVDSDSKGYVLQLFLSKFLFLMETWIRMMGLVVVCRKYVWESGHVFVRTVSILNLLFGHETCGDTIDAYMNIICSEEYQTRHGFVSNMAYMSTCTTVSIVQLSLCIHSFRLSLTCCFDAYNCVRGIFQDC